MAVAITVAVHQLIHTPWAITVRTVAITAHTAAITAHTAQDHRTQHRAHSDTAWTSVVLLLPLALASTVNTIPTSGTASAMCTDQRPDTR